LPLPQWIFSGQEEANDETNDETNNETNSVNEHNMVKYSNWQESDQLAIYKHDQRVELWTTKNNTSWWSERDLNL